jgi:hypothetical protein
MGSGPNLYGQNKTLTLPTATRQHFKEFLTFAVLKTDEALIGEEIRLR